MCHIIFESHIKCVTVSLSLIKSLSLSAPPSLSLSHYRHERTRNLLTTICRTSSPPSPATPPQQPSRTSPRRRRLHRSGTTPHLAGDTSTDLVAQTGDEVKERKLVKFNLQLAGTTTASIQSPVSVQVRKTVGSRGLLGQGLEFEH